MFRPVCLISIEPVDHVLITTLASPGGRVTAIKVQRHDTDEDDADNRHGESCPDAGLF